MTALTQDRNTPMTAGVVFVAPVAASTKILAGSIVAANASGFAVPGSTSATLTALGCADGQVDNSSGANGAKTVSFRRGVFKFANLAADAITQADLGKTAYIVDDQTVARTNGTNTRSAAGKVLGLDADGVWIEIK